MSVFLGSVREVRADKALPRHSLLRCLALVDAPELASCPSRRSSLVRDWVVFATDSTCAQRHAACRVQAASLHSESLGEDRIGSAIEQSIKGLLLSEGTWWRAESDQTSEG